MVQSAFERLRNAAFSLYGLIPLHKTPNRREREKSIFPLWKFPMLSGFISAADVTG
jgi:hypothetical protein